VKTPDEYLASVRDGRAVYIHGERVDDVTAHADFRLPLGWACSDYETWPGEEDLQFYITEEGDEARRLFQAPTSADDLLLRWRLLERSSIVGGLVNCVFAPLTVADELAAVDPQLAENARNFYVRCRRDDLRLAEVVTDVKGDRSRHPVEQDDPDLYLRVVDRNPDGIVVRGAKVHITASAIVHELLVIPTKAMRPGEEHYSVAFAIPVSTPGVKIINRAPATGRNTPFDYPWSGRKYLHEGFVIFDDVFVPRERVFMDGQTQLAGTFAQALGLWERAMGSIQGVRRAHMFVGMAQLLAEFGGRAKDPLVQDRIAELMVSARIARTGLESAMAKPRSTKSGLVYPDERPMQVAGYYGASNYHNVVRTLQEIGGPALISLPREADYRREELTGLVDEWLDTEAAPAEDRLLMYNLVRDLTTDSFGSHARLVSVQGAGGLAAPRIITYRTYNKAEAVQAAKDAAGILPHEDA
jgi:4-hydroxybutyryl-CoA dehydratase/vinylacetyl-CoA-Delta-isomerase